MMIIFESRLTTSELKIAGALSQNGFSLKSKHHNQYIIQIPDIHCIRSLYICAYLDLIDTLHINLPLKYISHEFLESLL